MEMLVLRRVGTKFGMEPSNAIVFLDRCYYLEEARPPLKFRKIPLTSCRIYFGGREDAQS